MKFNQRKYIEELQHLVSNNAITDNNIGLKKNIEFITTRLLKLGFEVKFIGENTNTPVIYAIRKSESQKGKIGIYSHYDVELTNDAQWNTPSTELTLKDERLFGRGIADNLGIWLLRMFAVEALELKGVELPEIHWLFQGQEEIGSPLAHEEFGKLDIPKIDVWFEETGYFDLGTTRQRFLTLNEDKKLSEAKGLMTKTLNEFEFTTYTENRSLTKFDKCPFLTHILKEQPYWAVGPNDEYSKIHEPNESLSLPLIEKSYEQFKDLMIFYKSSKYFN
jgi:hypothetical protein